MSRSTISTFQLFAAFPDEESARKYIESRLWKDGVKCAKCKSGDRITERKGGFYRCNACKPDFTVRTAEPAVARPFLKWVGGKRSILPELMSRMPDK